MAMIDNSIEVAKSQIVDLRAKLVTMRKNRADFFTRVDTLRKSIATARQAIAEVKAATATDKTPEVLAFHRENVAVWLTQLAGLSAPPGGEGSVQYKAVQQRIADLETQVGEDAAQEPYHADFYDASAKAIQAARAIRQAAVGFNLEAEATTAQRLASESAANRLKELDGSF